MFVTKKFVQSRIATLPISTAKQFINIKVKKVTKNSSLQRSDFRGLQTYGEPYVPGLRAKWQYSLDFCDLKLWAAMQLF